MFTIGLQNPYLERITEKLDFLGRCVIAQGSQRSAQRSQDSIAEGLQSSAQRPQDCFDHRVFHEAVLQGEVEVAELLLDQDLSPHILKDGRSPLYIACEKEDVAMASLLLSKGASPIQKNSSSCQLEWDAYSDTDDTPMQIAVAKGNLELVKLLQGAGALIDESGIIHARTPLFRAVDEEQETMALFLIGQGANFNIKDRYGSSLILKSVQYGLLEVVRELVRRGIKVADEDRGKGYTCLYVAAGRNNSQLLNFLLRNGCQQVINVRWLGNYTPIASAVASGFAQNTRLLVEAGADLLLRYKDGYRDLDILDIAEKHLLDSQIFHKHLQEHLYHKLKEAKKNGIKNQEMTDLVFKYEQSVKNAEGRIKNAETIIRFLKEEMEKRMQEEMAQQPPLENTVPKRADIPLAQKKEDEIQCVVS